MEPASATAGLHWGPESYARLHRLVREKTGIDLRPYKGKFLERRLSIRLRATGQQRLAQYVELLEREPAELDRLLHCLTIHVSGFFRNRSTYEAIRDQVLPALFSPGLSRHVKIWSVGCARGEEPYSLAILVHEHLGRDRRGWDVQIHGIDVDDRVLEEAKAAEFTPAQLGEIEPGLARRYFVRNGRYRLVPEIRRMVRFHRRDILMGPPGADFDCVVCRNLLIYLERPAQEEVLLRFARALRAGGFLVLGRTEVFIGAGRAEFEVVDARERIYRRAAGGRCAAEGAEARRGA